MRLVYNDDIPLLYLVPTILVVALFYAEILQCNTLTTPYIVAAYFSMTNR